MSRRDIRLPEELDHTTLLALRDDVLGTERGATIVLRGATDQVFCRGLALGSLVGVSAGQRSEGLDAFEATLLHLATSHSPTIAMLDGAGMGGGLGLAAACDVVVASSRAQCSLPELLFGLVPGMIFPVLRQRVSGPRLRRLTIEGAAISADEAASWGLVDEVVPHDELEQRVAGWVRRFRRSERGAVGRLKRWVADADDLRQAVRLGREHLAELIDSPVAAARIQAFSEGLAPWES